ncbi:DgyrCDS12109 [Dimorphilus gyrociliatus]|uniref:DgyrCDS12109 n=1 Tax=Dimorphilus gyrociliatus TaxID=2664684 RepID=A0A7I8W5L4_9ANNE|nr:DgyrCDS12109 [Dimorphilus gyrociliatus]
MKPFPWDSKYFNNVEDLLNKEEKLILNQIKSIFPDRLPRYIIHSIKHPDHFEFTGNDLLTHCVDDILNFRTGNELDSFDLKAERMDYVIKHRVCSEFTGGDILEIPSTSHNKPDASNQLIPGHDSQILTAEEVYNELSNIFIEVDPEYLMKTINNYNEQSLNENTVNDICDYLLSNTYPKKPKKKHGSYGQENETPVETVDSDVIFRSFTFEFPQLRSGPLKEILLAFNNDYALARACLTKELKEVNLMYRKKTFEVEGKPFFSVLIEGTSTLPVITIPLPNGKISRIHFLKRSRRFSREHYMNLPHHFEKILQSDTDVFKAETAKAESEKNQLDDNHDFLEDDSEPVECGCCFSDIAFRDMIQCADGHLFCKDCLRNYAKEAIFGGGGQSILQCMNAECDCQFPHQLLQTTLDQKTLEKMDERQFLENITKAKISNLHSCPFCNYKVIVPENNKVLECERCERGSCIYCREEWDDHFGKPCHEIEKSDEASLRKKFEEEMTQAKVRKCYQCGTSLIKSEGCNKMTCRCGAKFCYVCRSKIKSYDHFCNHPRDPNIKRCLKCTKCMLFTNAEADDEQAIKELKCKAIMEKQKRGFDEKDVGVPEVCIKKKKY